VGTAAIRPDQDAAVWDEEGEVVLADMRRPSVRAQVRRIALAQSQRLDARLLAAGLHVTQWRDRPGPDWTGYPTWP
jgi:hypothetical protein